jgi:hypothetical protein
MRCTAQDFFHSKGIPGLLRRNLRVYVLVLKEGKWPEELTISVS